MQRKNFLKNFRKRSRWNASRQCPHFEQLEARQMLAADLGSNRIEQLLEQYTADDFVQGFDSALTNIEETVDTAAAAVNQIPLIGSQLVAGVEPFLNVLGDMRVTLKSNIESAFAQAGIDENASVLELYEGAIFQVFGPNGLDSLQDGSDADTDISVADIVRTSGMDEFISGGAVPDSEWVQWNVHLAQQFHVDIPIDAKIDIESLSGSSVLANLGFSLETTGSLRLSVDWEAYLGWGVTLGNTLSGVDAGFFLDAAAANEIGEDVEEFHITINVAAAPETDAFGNELPNAPSGLSGNLSLGFVNGHIEDGTVDSDTGVVKNTSFTVDLGVDVYDDSIKFHKELYLPDSNQALFDRVSQKELSEKIDAERVADVLTPQVDATGQVRLHFSTDTGSLLDYAKVDLGIAQASLGLPELAFDLNVGASASYSYIRVPGPFDVFLPTAGIDELALNNVSLDVSPLLNGIVTPMANLIGVTLDPLFDLFGVGFDAGLGFLKNPIPLLDLIGPPMGFGKPSILDLPGVGVKLDPFFDAIGDIFGLPGDIANFLQAYNGFPINFGSWEFDFEADIMKRINTHLPGSIDVEAFASLYGERLQRGGFELDIIKPSEILDMLLGNHFDIVSYNLPAFAFGLGGDFGFDFQVLSFGIHAGADLQLEPISFVYDSAGLGSIVEAIRAGVVPDFEDLRDGFYIRNRPGREFSLNVDVGGRGGVDAGFFFAGAHAALGGELFLDLQDPNEDGKLRLNEIFEITDGFTNPQQVIQLFDAGVDIAGDFNFEGGVRIKIGPFKKTFSVSLSGLGIPDRFDVGLSLSDVFGYAVAEPQPAGEPSLATEVIQDGLRVLRISTGPFASDRVNGSTDDSAGINVSGRDGSIVVTADLPGRGPLEQSFSANADRVVIVGTDAADTIDFSGLSSIAVEVHALGGNDIITTGGGNDIIFAGAGNDIVNTGAGNDSIFAGAGNDTIHAGAGDDLVLGAEGNDIIQGQAGADTSTAGATTTLSTVEQTTICSREIAGTISSMAVPGMMSLAVPQVTIC